MKSVLATIALVSSFALPAFAAAPSQELMQVTRALINNSSLVLKLQENNTPMMTDIKVTEMKPGVTKYDLVFERDCFCFPATSTVSIVEDMTPTYADGAPKYESSLKFEEVR